MLTFYSNLSKLGTLRLLSRTAESAVMTHPIQCICCVNTALPKVHKTRISLALEVKT